MGKNRKKPRNKGAKNRRYQPFSNAAVNTGPPQTNPVNPGSGRKAVPGVTQVGAAEYRERAASIGKPEAPLRHSRDELVARSRYMQNQISMHHVREMWRGPRHQGITDFFMEVHREIKFYYKVALLFSGHQFIWMYEDWRTEKRKFSIVYGSRERALQAFSLGYEDERGRGIVWKFEVDFEGNVKGIYGPPGKPTQDIINSYAKAVAKF